MLTIVGFDKTAAAEAVLRAALDKISKSEHLIFCAYSHRTMREYYYYVHKHTHILIPKARFCTIVAILFFSSEEEAIFTVKVSV